MKVMVIVTVAFVLCTLTAYGQITSAGSGNWNATATWVGGVVPTTTDIVVIANGHKVSINSNVTVASVTVGQGASGTLTFDNAAARTVNVTGNVNVAAGGSFVTTQLATTGNTNTSTQITGVASTAGLAVGMNISGIGIPAGTTITAFDATTITLSVAATATATGVSLSMGYNSMLLIGGNLANNGTFDMSLGNGAGVCQVKFNKAGDQTISGSVATTRFAQITLDKSTVANKVSSTINVATRDSNIVFVAGTWEQAAGELFATGTINIGSATNSAGGLSIIGSGGATVTSSVNVYGALLVNTTDSLVVGSGSNKIDMTYANGAATFTKGTVLVYGKFVLAALGKNTINGATILIDPKGFAAAVPAGTDYAFRSTTGTGGTNSFVFSSGTINIMNTNTTTGASPELAMSASVAPNISGLATFVLGQGSKTLASTQGFRINLNSVGILNNLIVNTGSVDVVLQTNVVLNGKLTITSSGALSGPNFTWSAPKYEFNGTSAQVTGSIMPATVKSVIINNPAGVTSSQALTITDTLFLVSGTLSGPFTAGTTVKVSTDVQDESTGVPQEYSLQQNYPNPFNPSTSISYRLPANSVVALRIFDVLGREAAVLVHGQQPAGTHTVGWNAVNVPSGVYFCRLEAYTTSGSSYVETRKMLLTK